MLVCLKCNELRPIQSLTKSRNHQDFKPPKTLQKSGKIDFCSADIFKGAIYYHNVAVPLRGAWIWSLLMTLTAQHFKAIQY